MLPNIKKQKRIWKKIFIFENSLRDSGWLTAGAVSRRTLKSAKIIENNDSC